jgi:predicted NBD/HSP70 family sugar kinase
MTVEHRKVALLDIGGTKTRFAWGDVAQAGSLQNIESTSTPYQYDEFLSLMQEFRNRQQIPFVAVGVSFGVGLREGVIRAASKMPDFVGRNLRADLERIFEAPVEIHHDCVCVLASVARELDHEEAWGYVTVSTGLGAAVVTRMKTLLLFERIRLAHHVVDLNSPQRCACGRVGCLATFVDSAQLRSRGVAVDALGDDAASWESYLAYLSVGLANFCRLFGLTRLLLGGGVLRNSYVAKHIVDSIRANLPDDGYPRASISILEDEELAPLKGASATVSLPNALYREY